VTINKRIAAARRERPVLARVVRAAWRLEQAEREQTWALISDRAEAISIRTLAAAIGLSPSPVHQLMADADPDALDAALGELRAAGWPLPAQLPGQLTLLRASETGGRSDVVVDLAYSDGLSVISLFVQRGHLPAQLNGWSEVALHGDHVYASGRDQRSVAWSARGFVYTLIADAPDQTLDQVVDVLPHNGGPGFFGRIGHGLSRLVSWVDPFD